MKKPLLLIVLSALAGAMAQAQTASSGMALIRSAAYQPKKYVADFNKYLAPAFMNAGLQPYYELDEGLKAAATLHRPAMVYFDGINCVNCRKMESQVFAHPDVLSMLTRDFVVIFLYCDANHVALPAGEQYNSKEPGMRVKTVGDRNSDIEITHFSSNAMPMLFFLSAPGRQLTDKPYAYDPDPQKFLAVLHAVKERYAK